MGGLSRGERQAALVPTRAAGGLGSAVVDSAAYGAHLASVVAASGTELHQRHGDPSSFGSATGVACRASASALKQLGNFDPVTCNGGGGSYAGHGGGPRLPCAEPMLVVAIEVLL